MTSAPLTATDDNLPPIQCNVATTISLLKEIVTSTTPEGIHLLSRRGTKQTRVLQAESSAGARIASTHQPSLKATTYPRRCQLLPAGALDDFDSANLAIFQKPSSTASALPCQAKILRLPTSHIFTTTSSHGRNKARRGGPATPISEATGHPLPSSRQKSQDTTSSS